LYARRAVVSLHPLLARLAYKEGLAQHAESEHLRPRTIAGPARARLAPRRGYVIKPSDGSLGRGVARLVSAHGCTIDVPPSSVLQHEVRCATHRGRKADVRIWVALDCRGVARPWVSPSSLVRVARSDDQFATNSFVGAASGLPCLDFEDADWWHVRAAACARGFATSVTAQLRADARPMWTLLGLDVAIDVGGRPWLLEINSLPAMWHADAPSLRRMYASWLLSMARHISNANSRESSS
jgi:hypothetical protein